jgi:hypothetical protein
MTLPRGGEACRFSGINEEIHDAMASSFWLVGFVNAFVLFHEDLQIGRF